MGSRDLRGGPAPQLWGSLVHCDGCREALRLEVPELTHWIPYLRALGLLSGFCCAFLSVSASMLRPSISAGSLPRDGMASKGVCMRSLGLDAIQEIFPKRMEKDDTGSGQEEGA